MNPRELRKLIKELEHLKRLRELKKIVDVSKDVGRQQKILGWLKSNRERLSEMNDHELSVIREKAEYDEEEWEAILKQFLKT